MALDQASNLSSSLQDAISTTSRYHPPGSSCIKHVLYLNPLRNPLVFSILIGVAFFLVTEFILIFPYPFNRVEIDPLTPSDLISLLTGAVTAAGLAGIYAQILARTDDARRNSALQLDSLHAYFNSTQMRENRTLAFVYLSFLLQDQVAFEQYAKYWINSAGCVGATPNKNDLRKIFPHESKQNCNVYDDWAKRPFLEYDAAVSAVISFFVRLAVHLKQSELANQLSDDTREAVSPFFWHSYWREKVMPFADLCVEIQNDKLSEFELPYFVIPLRRLTDQLRPKPIKKEDIFLPHQPKGIPA